MNAADLRQVAAEIRETANAATPGPWFVTTEAARYGGLVANVPGDEDDGYGGKLIGETLQVGNRKHIAAWHPAVALAVADWLEAEADRRDLGSLSVAVGGVPLVQVSESAAAFVRAWRGES